VVKIRLKRLGAAKRPYYRLVVADARSPRDGRFIEEIGTYDPIQSPARVVIDADRVRDWIRKGARPSDTARKLLEREGILPRTPRAAAPAQPAAAVAESPAAPAAAEAASAETPAAPAAAEHATADAEPTAEGEG
jgi:small subunit ribosomal protein S16